MTSRPVDLKLAELESALAKLEKSIGADMNELREDQQVSWRTARILNTHRNGQYYLHYISSSLG